MTGNEREWAKMKGNGRERAGMSRNEWAETLSSEADNP